MSDNTERLRNHVASYISMSSHRQNCLDVCTEAEQAAAKIEHLTDALTTVQREHCPQDSECAKYIEKVLEL